MADVPLRIVGTGDTSQAKEEVAELRQEIAETAAASEAQGAASSEAAAALDEQAAAAGAAAASLDEVAAAELAAVDVEMRAED
jgi:hypothetical protein